MEELNREIIQFFQEQSFVIISTIDRKGIPHNSCKGLIDIGKDGKVYLLDLYRSNTYKNLKRNKRISIAAVDEHKFKGYCLKGRAKELRESELDTGFIRAWEDRITSRLTQRVIRNMKEKKGHLRHPEILLPKPEYLIVMEAQEVVDLTPQHLK